jgi:hypothetical protein
MKGKKLHKRLLLLQELTTDEAVIAWNDGTMTFIRKHGLLWIVCNRRFMRYSFQIVNCNEF